MIDWLACAFVKVAGAVLCRVPPAVAVWLGERLGALAFWLQPTRTRIGLRNLRAAFDGALTPARSRRIILDCYRQLGAGVLELLRLPVIDRAYVERHIAIEGLAHFEQAVASGRPVIVLTGHYGNWELSAITAALRGYPAVVLARAQEKLPRLYRLLVSYRESKGCTIIHKGGAMKRLFTALKARQLVGIVGDQASRRGQLADLFGRPALFATGPFQLAYRTQALIVPFFIHRVQGPFHRIVVGPALELPGVVPEPEAVREGIERFAGILSRHVRDDPSQWLWMHKRWKQTPARRALILSDGKAGHLKQSVAALEAARRRRPALSSRIVEVRYRHALGRLACLLWSWCVPRGIGSVRCLRWALSRKTAADLLSRYGDLVISCGSAVAPVNLLWAAENGAKSVVIMNPAPLPLGRFDLVIAPTHDGLPARSNVVQVIGALSRRIAEDALLESGRRLCEHPRFRAACSAGRASASPEDGGRAGTRAAERRPIVSVFVGGDTLDYALNRPFAEALVGQVIAACEAADGSCLVTTSRRTSPEVERLLAEGFATHPRCPILVIANRDALDGAMEGMLGLADVAVVTGESISMVSEACASGRRVVVVEPPLRRTHEAGMTKHERFLRQLSSGGYVRRVATPELAEAIRQLLVERSPSRRLDHEAPVEEAIARLL